MNAASVRPGSVAAGGGTLVTVTPLAEDQNTMVTPGVSEDTLATGTRSRWLLGLRPEALGALDDYLRSYPNTLTGSLLASGTELKQIQSGQVRNRKGI